jgi:inhibitor of cysteine peptidase
MKRDRTLLSAPVVQVQVILLIGVGLLVALSCSPTQLPILRVVATPSITPSPAMAVITPAQPLTPLPSPVVTGMAVTPELPTPTETPPPVPTTPSPMPTGVLGYTTIQGRVYDASQASQPPIAGAVVTYSASGPTNNWQEVASTDAGGIYTLHPFMHDTDNVTIQAVAPGYADARVQLSALDLWGSPTLDIGLTAVGPTAGLGPTQVPLAGATPTLPLPTLAARPIFFTKGGAGGALDLWVKEPAEAKPRQLTQKIWIADFVPSPDGSAIAYISMTSGVPPESGTTGPVPVDVWVMAADGSNPVQISRNPSSGPVLRSLPAWSPDGQQLVWAEPDALILSTRDGSSQQTLYSGLHHAPNIFNWMLEGPIWSPTGEGILFKVGCRFAGGCSTAFIRPDGGGYRLVVDATATGYSGGHYAWWARLPAPGNKTVAAYALWDGRKFSWWSLDVTDSAAQPQAIGPLGLLSPNTTFVLYSQPGRVMLASLGQAGNPIQGLITASELDALFGNFAWTPDSAYLLYVASDGRLIQFDVRTQRSEVIAERVLKVYGAPPLYTPVETGGPGPVPATPTPLRPAGEAVRMTEQNSGQIVEIQAGQQIVITLKSNPTTGYKWELTSELNPAILELVSQEYIAPQGGAIGAGGEEVWEFQGVGRGESSIVLEYRRSWEKNQPPVNSFFAKVVVR